MWKLASPTGAVRVAMTSMSSPSKQRDRDTVTEPPGTGGLLPFPKAASAASAGAPSSRRLTWRIRTATITEITATVASLRRRGEGCQVTGAGAAPRFATASPGCVTDWPWAPARR